jgi:hypothetical protein
MQTVKPAMTAALSALFGLAFAGGLGLTPAAAQDNDMDNGRMNNRPIESPSDIIDPMPLSYPWAAPASLHQYHWRDYTQTMWEPGSVSDARLDQRMQMEKYEHDRYMRDRGVAATEEREMIDPMPFSYPWAAPASIHQYHWRDYTKTVWEPGSVEDVRFEAHRAARERMRQEMGTIPEDPNDIDPMPLSYPWAAPASIHQYHWRDYTKTMWEPGSVSDARYEQRMKREEQIKNDLQRDRDEMNRNGGMNK